MSGASRDHDFRVCLTIFWSWRLKGGKKLRPTSSFRNTSWEPRDQIPKTLFHGRNFQNMMA